ncbi:hypothetical protein NQD34_018336 [Periophthalmus magnuspinnatus]|nr:hypothetical protein NQD34_018336 [Periophthalmus magnuspinnatus]
MCVPAELQSLFQAPVHGAIDMWSVGCIAAQMFLGAPLFPARDEQDMMKLIVETVGHLLSPVWTRVF